MALIEIAHVQKALGPKVVYRDLSLSVERGETLAIIGGSGQGKSVMLKLLIGLIPIDAGEIRFDGEVISGGSERDYASVRQRIAMLFQSGAVFDSLDVYENVAYGLREHMELSEEDIDARVRRALENVGLSELRRAWPTELSVGMRKRVGLARAIATHPEVILYDEPTTGLDPIRIKRIAELIVRLSHSLEVTSLVVTHDMESAYEISDRIAMIQDGGIIFSGTVDELRHTDDARVRNFIEGNAPHDEDVEALLRSAG